MNQQQFETRYNALLTEKVKDCVFPADKIPEEFNDYVLICMPHITHRVLQCSIEEYEKVADFAGNGGDCSLATMSISLQIARSCPAATIGVNLAVYCAMQVHVDEMARISDVVLKPYQEKVMQAIQAEDALEKKKAALQGGGKRIVLPN